MIKTTIVGNLTRDPETRTVICSGEEKTVTNFTVAVNVCYGEKKRTEFVRVTAWEKRADICAKYLSKGSKVLVIGIPSVNVYMNNENNPSSNLELKLEEIEFLSKSVVSDTADDDIDDIL